LVGCTTGSQTSGKPRQKYVDNAKEDGETMHLTLEDSTGLQKTDVAGEKLYNTWAAST